MTKLNAIDWMLSLWQSFRVGISANNRLRPEHESVASIPPPFADRRSEQAFLITSLKNGWLNQSGESVLVATNAIIDAICNEQNTATCKVFYGEHVVQYLAKCLPDLISIERDDRVYCRLTIKIHLDYANISTADLSEIKARLRKFSHDQNRHSKSSIITRAV